MQWLSKSKAESDEVLYNWLLGVWLFHLLHSKDNRPEGRNCNEDETRVKTREEDHSLAPLLPCLVCLPYSQQQQLPSINCVSHYFWNLVLFFFRIVGLRMRLVAKPRETTHGVFSSSKMREFPKSWFLILFYSFFFSSGPSIYLLSMWWSQRGWRDNFWVPGDDVNRER